MEKPGRKWSEWWLVLFGGEEFVARDPNYGMTARGSADLVGGPVYRHNARIDMEALTDGEKLDLATNIELAASTAKRLRAAAAGIEAADEPRVKLQ